MIDLRQPSEVAQSDLAAVDHQGLRYLSIPMTKDAIDPAALARLEAELAREDSRPIFLFDADGVRPAVAGFLHLATVRKMDARSAEREVEDLGAGESPLWKAAVDHLAKTKPVALNADRPSILDAWRSIRPSAWGGVSTYVETAFSLGGQTLANLPVVPNGPELAPTVLVD